MHSSFLLSLLLGTTLGAAAALPALDVGVAFNATPEAQKGLNSTSLPVLLQADDVIVIGGDDNVLIMKDHEFDEMVRRRDELFSQEEEKFRRHMEAIQARGDDVIPVGRLEKRACDRSTELQIMGRSEFSNWDVAMSSVIQATGAEVGPQNTVSVTSGYSLSDGLTIGASATVNIIQSILSASLDISATRTWTTSYNAAYTFAVATNNYALVVSNPWTHRVWGYTLSGCANSWTSEYFQSDMYDSQSYDNMAWVRGVIRLCSSTQYPVPFCTGSGQHY